MKTYPAHDVDQHDPHARPPVMPVEPTARRLWAEHLAADAAVFGTGPVLQYGEMYVTSGR